MKVGGSFPSGTTPPQRGCSPDHGCTVPQRPVDFAISEGVLTPEALENLGSYTSGLEIDGKPSRSVWKRMARDLGETGTLPESDVKRVEHFVRDVKSRRTELRKALKEQDDPQAGRELRRAEGFVTGYTKIGYCLTEAAYKSSIQALAGCDFGPAGVVAAYAAATHASRDHVAELVEHLEELESGASDYLFDGNDVEPVHGEKLWQAKMRLLDEAIESAESGKPLEIDAQYYELTNGTYLDKVIRAARAGCPVRINVDPSRAREGGDGDQSLHVDDGPKTFRSLIALSQVPNVDVGFSVYPVNQQLGNGTGLMHRKLLRVGEKVLLCGMNANSGSGENVDAGWILKGPAARNLVEGFARDVRNSLYATKDDVYNQDALMQAYNKELILTPHGLANLLDTLGRPGSIGYIPYEPNYQFLQQKAGEAGVRLEELLAMESEQLQKSLESNRRQRQKLPLSDLGKKLLYQQMTTALRAARQPHNIHSLRNVELPEGQAAGTAKVGIGDKPVEREALVLHAIQTAEEFIYVPTFVITRPIARALAVRRDELKREGKKLDIRVVADSGLYAYGGTPNEHGVLPLEDAGIPVRWALLPRSIRHHDRKIHAKQIITDKMEFFGSTNLSRKGLNENWEVSGLVFFDENDPGSLADRDESKDRFLKLWDRESFLLDTRKTAEKWLEDTSEFRREQRLPGARRRVIRTLLRRINQFEHQSAELVEEQLSSTQAGARAAELIRDGLAPGYARLIAVEESLGTEEFYHQLNQLPAMSQLRSLRRYG